MVERILGPGNESDPDLQEVLNIKRHFLPQSSWRINPSNLDELLVDIVSNDLIYLLSGRQKVPRGIERVLEWGKTI